MSGQNCFNGAFITQVLAVRMGSQSFISCTPCVSYKCRGAGQEGWGCAGTIHGESQMRKSMTILVHHPVAFSAFSVLCNHHLHLVPKHFHHPKEATYPLAVTPHFLFPQPPATKSPSVSVSLTTLDVLYEWDHIMWSIVTGSFHSE